MQMLCLTHSIDLSRRACHILPMPGNVTGLCIIIRTPLSTHLAPLHAITHADTGAAAGSVAGIGTHIQISAGAGVTAPGRLGHWMSHQQQGLWHGVLIKYFMHGWL